MRESEERSAGRPSFRVTFIFDKYVISQKMLKRQSWSYLQIWCYISFRIK
jgi:hypothetical protein